MKSPDIIERPHQISIENARLVIGEVRQNIAAMGANDSEFFELDQILKRLDDHTVEPEAAIQEARGILSNKQDYH